MILLYRDGTNKALGKDLAHITVFIHRVHIYGTAYAPRAMGKTAYLRVKILVLIAPHHPEKILNIIGEAAKPQMLEQRMCDRAASIKIRV